MADETIEVEATPIDQELTILTRAEKWLLGTSERVAKRREQYKPPERIESEQQRKDCAKARASVRRDVGEIDAERKAMLREVEDAIKQFKSSVKDVLVPLTDLDVEYKRLLDEYEEAWRTQRIIELSEEYEGIAPDLVELLPFERLMEHFGMTSGKVWTNRTTNIMAAKQMLGEAIFVIADAERTIREQMDGFGDDETKSALAFYFDTLDLQKALSNVRHMREQRERLARLEAERAAREAAWQQGPAIDEPPMQGMPAQAAPAQAEPTPAAHVDVPHAWVIIASSATKAQMLQLRDYARSVGIPFDCIYSGTLQEVYGRVGNA